MKAKIPTAALMLLLIVGCGSKTDEAKHQGAGSTSSEAGSDPEKLDGTKRSGQRELFDRNAARPDLDPALKIGGAEGRSPFVGDRVIGLNAIVRRSLDAVNEFEAKYPAISAAVESAVQPGASAEEIAAAQSGMATVNALYDRAKLAFDEMTFAETDLRASGEYFDKSIFDGMSKFTKDVEIEIGEAKAGLAKKLGQLDAAQD